MDSGNNEKALKYIYINFDKNMRQQLFQMTVTQQLTALYSTKGDTLNDTSALHV